MGKLTEMLLQNGLLYNHTDGTQYRINGAQVTNNLTVSDPSGRVVYKVERSANGVDLILVDYATNRVVMRLDPSLLAA